MFPIASLSPVMWTQWLPFHSPLCPAPGQRLFAPTLTHQCPQSPCQRRCSSLLPQAQGLKEDNKKMRKEKYISLIGNILNYIVNQEILTCGKNDVSVKVLQFFQQLTVNFLQHLLHPTLIHSFSLWLIPGQQHTYFMLKSY